MTISFIKEMQPGCGLEGGKRLYFEVTYKMSVCLH